MTGPHAVSRMFPIGVGDGVAEDRELALRFVLDRAERGRDGAGPGAGAEEDDAGSSSGRNGRREAPRRAA